MAEPSLEISIANDLRELAGVAAQVDGFCDAHGLGAPTAYAVNLSIDEILSNTIGYGYEDDDAHRIELVVRLDGETVTVLIVDDARPFDVSAPPGAIAIRSAFQAATTEGLRVRGGTVGCGGGFETKKCKTQDEYLSCMHDGRSGGGWSRADGGGCRALRGPLAGQ